MQWQQEELLELLEHGNINDCYNIGNISYQNTDFIQCGGITGRDGDPNFSYSTIQNSYYLNTKTSVASYNYSNGGYNANTEGAKTETQMKEKSFISTLGDAYTEDTQNNNNGYPILKWQLEKNK